MDPTKRTNDCFATSGQSLPPTMTSSKLMPATTNRTSFVVLTVLTFVRLISVSRRYQVESFAAGLSAQPGVNVPSRPASRLLSSEAQCSQRGTGGGDDHTRHDVFLFSLKWTPDDRISKDVRSLWKWKDSTLGDGRDFFVPKPKTLKKLQDHLLKYCTGLRECSILSNCARLEVLCTTSTARKSSSPCPSRSSNYTALEAPAAVACPPFEVQLLDDVSLCLASQMLYANSNAPSLWSQLLVPTQMDRPDAVLNLDCPPTDMCNDRDVLYDVQRELSKHWEIIRGPSDVLWHLCEVSAGMAARPRRPDRTTLFRPFSSRDAHILLQLKRTKEIVSVTRDIGWDKSGERHSAMDDNSLDRRQQTIPLLLEYALRAGKAARNPNVVPELILLREDTLLGGSAGLNSGTSTASLSSSSSSIRFKGIINGVIADRMTDLEKSRQVAAIARTKAIEPLVQECMGKILINTDQRGEAIANLRARALEMVLRSEQGGDDEVELLWLKQKLHEPTMELRNKGQLVSYNNTETFLDVIRDELEDFRRIRGRALPSDSVKQTEHNKAFR